MLRVTKRHRKARRPEAKSRLTDSITGRLRGEALYKARGRCSNCGRSIEKHDVVLVVDYKIPREWGVLSDEDNLWAICEDCIKGNRSCFRFVDAAWMRRVMALKSVHMRLGETLKALKGQPVPAQMMAFVANQNDWKKRVRELRYLGWKIDVNPSKHSGRLFSCYRLTKSRTWPEDPTGVIRQYEQERANRNRNS
jgi:HNH endonuclease